MSENNEDPNNVPPTPTQETIDKLIAEKVAESLKDIKGKLDSSFAARDEALAKLKVFEEKERESEIKLLEEQGKLKEAYELRLAEKEKALAEMEAEKKHLATRNNELSRDSVVKGLLAGVAFRNPKAHDIAFRDVVSNLVQNADGKWVTKTNESIEAFIATYQEDKDNSFLFEPKISSGAGNSTRPAGVPPESDGSLFSMPQSEVLKLAAEGKLRRK